MSFASPVRIGSGVRRFAASLLRRLRFTFGAYVQRCESCGRRDDICWWSPPELWHDVVQPDDGGIRCIPCFHRECQERGILLRWVPRIDAKRGSEGRWAQHGPPDPELFPVAARVHREDGGGQC